MMSQTESKDDPIFGSLGLIKPKMYGMNSSSSNNTDFLEGEFENRLSKLKPV